MKQDRDLSYPESQHSNPFCWCHQYWHHSDTHIYPVPSGKNWVKNLANFKLYQFTFRNFWKSLAWAILFFLTYIWGRCGGRSGTPAGMSASSMIKFPSLVTRTIKRRTGTSNFLKKWIVLHLFNLTSSLVQLDQWAKAPINNF